ncbi:hypothetical protein UFOVP706_45 [uncultured Caudovirales phage]|uniref:Uncharacterized protein n=1 Tax=uncultured Caudovirales phage TaxID=2100421 RepID=A0A6J5NMN4_9CAUD|nr:hypothetical protein UFOVP706_45 [uncultured Caudovirales phage]
MFGALLGGGAVSAGLGSGQTRGPWPPPPPTMPYELAGNSWGGPEKPMTAREIAMRRVREAKEGMARWLDPSLREQDERVLRSEIRASQMRTMPASIAALKSFSAVNKERMWIDEIVRRTTEDRVERQRNQRFWALLDLQKVSKGGS